MKLRRLTQTIHAAPYIDTEYVKLRIYSELQTIYAAPHICNTHTHAHTCAHTHTAGLAHWLIWISPWSCSYPHLDKSKTKGPPMRTNFLAPSNSRSEAYSESNADYAKNITRKTEWNPQTQSTVWDTYNAIAQPNSHPPWHMERTMFSIRTSSTEVNAIMEPR